MRAIAVRLFIAFLCVVVFLVVQGLFAYYNARSLADVQSQALKRELDIRDLENHLAEARLIVFRILGTMDPVNMDAAHHQFKEVLDSVDARLEGLGIEPDLVAQNRELYERIIQNHYDFYVRTARDLMDNQSRDLHEKIVSRLDEMARRSEEESRRQVEEAHRRMLAGTMGLLISALAVSVIMALVLMRSLTDRREAEAALRESEEKYREIFNSMIDMYYRIDGQGKVEMIAPSVERVLGYRPEEMIGRPIREFYADPELRDRFMAALQEQGELTGYEIPVLARNGALIWLSLNTQLYRDASENQVYVQGVARDITARKKAEEDRRRLENQLRHSHKMEAVGTLAGGIAHDFNNILSAIIGYTELTMMDLPPDAPLLNNLNQIIRAASRARELIQQILTFSRKAQQDRRPVDLAPIVNEALGFLRASLPTTIDIQVEAREGLGAVMADATQLQQVLMNLGANAAHAMNDRGGLLEITLDRTEVVSTLSDGLQVVPPGSYIRLMVRDNGRGIPPDTLGRVFEPFFTTKGPGKGTGMGLAVVHGIVEGHGGAITMDSVEDRGTTVRVYLPVVDGDADWSEAEREHVSLTGKERVLVVDDEEALVEIAGRALARLGYQVTTTTDSAEALEKIRSDVQAFDVVVTDQTMPRYTGLDIVGEVRRRSPILPVILCTGYSEILEKVSSEELGVSAVLMKPVSMSDLARKIREVLDGGEAPASMD